jgi:hypothetical protein
MDNYTKSDSNNKKLCRGNIYELGDRFLDNRVEDRNVLLLDGKEMLESTFLIRNGYTPANIILPNNCRNTHNLQCLKNIGVGLYFGSLNELLPDIKNKSLSLVDYDACGMPGDLSDIKRIIDSKLRDKAVLGVTFCCRNKTKLPKNKLGETTYSNMDYTLQEIISYANVNGYMISVTQNYSYKDPGSTTMFRQLYTLEKIKSEMLEGDGDGDVGDGDGDGEEYVIESLIKFDAPRKQVLVKWEGYEEMNWEPHEQFKGTDLWKDLMKIRYGK